MTNLHCTNIAAAAVIVLLASGCANRELRETAGEVSQEVGSLMSQVATHRKIETARIVADVGRIDDLNHLTKVQTELAEMDRTVLAMAGARTALEAWKALDAHLANVEAGVVRRAADDPATTKATTKLQPLPTELYAALVKDLETLAVTPDRKARLATFIAYGETVGKTIMQLQKDAEKKTSADD